MSTAPLSEPRLAAAVPLSRAQTPLAPIGVQLNDDALTGTATAAEIRTLIAQYGLVSLPASAAGQSLLQDLTAGMSASDPLPIEQAWRVAGGFLPVIPQYAALTVPADGTTVLAFSDARLAFEKLDPRLAAYVETLSVITYADSLGSLAHAFGREKGSELALSHPAHQTPIVATDALSGRKYLTINESFTNYVRGVERIFGNNLLGILFDQLEALDVVMTHAPSPGSMILWNNRAVQHRLVAAAPGREAIRAILFGE